MAASLDKTKAIRCLLDVIGGQRSKENPQEFVDRIPKEMFGAGRARVNRKMVLIAIAASSDPNGSGAWPSLSTLAQRTLLNEKTVRRTIQWLVAHGLLEVQQYAGPAHSNRYRIIFGNLDSTCPSDSAGNLDTKCPSTPGVPPGKHKGDLQERYQNAPYLCSNLDSRCPSEPGQLEGNLDT